jgi:hypothetical protein
VIISVPVFFIIVLLCSIIFRFRCIKLPMWISGHL